MSIIQYFASKNISVTLRNLTENEVGGTGYIDRLDVNSFGSGVYIGVDPHGREYAAIKVKVTEFTEGADPMDEGTKMFVAFQRYMDRPDFWVCMEAGVNGTRNEVLDALVLHALKGEPRKSWSQGGYRYEAA